MSAPTLTIGLVMEARRKIVSGCIGRPRLDVAQTDAGQLGHLVPSRDERHGPGDLAALDATGNVRTGALEGLRRESSLLSRLHGPSLAPATRAATRTVSRYSSMASVAWSPTPP